MEKKLTKAEEKKLLKIARECIVTVEDRGSLETRHSDGEDFLDIAVWELRNALEKAYRLGKEGK